MFFSWPDAHVKVKAEEHNLASISRIFSAYHSCYQSFEKEGNLGIVLRLLNAAGLYVNPLWNDPHVIVFKAFC